MNIRPIALAALLALGAGAQAAPVDWNTWSSATSGTLGSGTTVTYASADPGQLVTGYPNYGLPGTFADGTAVDNAPLPGNNILRISGGSDGVNTLTFSTAVVNPVLAIWSLGQPSLSASFVFQGATPVLVSGGPSGEYGGSPIAVSGNTVSGLEGNGTVQFLGTYTSLSWTNPQYEYWYGFNVGVPEVSAVPEPETYALMLAGLGVMGAVARRRRGSR